MKYLILILFVLVITSCSKTVMSKEHHPSDDKNWCYEITDVELTTNRLARYTLNSNSWYRFFKNKLYYIDSIGKYRVGQKVFIALQIVSE